MPWAGEYFTYFRVAVPDKLTKSARLVVDRIGSYEEAREILNTLREASRAEESGQG